MGFLPPPGHQGDADEHSAGVGGFHPGVMDHPKPQFLPDEDGHPHDGRPIRIRLSRAVTRRIRASGVGEGVLAPSFMSCRRGAGPLGRRARERRRRDRQEEARKVAASP